MTQPSTYRLGRTPNDPSKPRVRLTADIAPAGFTPPASVDYYSHVPAQSWGMDGNDSVGDCTCAEVDHAIKALQVTAGNTEVTSSAAEVLAAYSAITGYNPANPSSDQGAMMQDVRAYWRKNGFTLGGKNDKIALFAEVDHTNLDLVRWCIDRFGEVGVGVNFPSSAMDQSNAGQPWDVVQGSPIEGGHAVAAVGYDASHIYLVTWGKVQPATWAWFQAYCEETWTQLSTDFVNGASGDDALGETLYALGQQFQQVTGQPNPFPQPAPAPAPAPSPAPTPAPAPSPAPTPAPTPTPQPTPPSPQPQPTPPDSVRSLCDRILMRRRSSGADVHAAEDYINWLGAQA